MPKSIQGKVAAFIAVLLVIVGLVFFLIPYLVTHQTWLWSYDERTGPIGDTIGGITGPIVGLFGVILTFFAFFIQFKANQIQVAAFNEQKATIARQENQILVQQFESNYFEMVKLHRENVNEMDYRDFKGRSAIVKIIDELSLLFESIKESSLFFDHNLSNRDVINITYLVSYYGTKDTVEDELENRMKFHYGDISADILIWIAQDVKRGIVVHNGKNPLVHFNGQQSRLGHYFRHLFRTVKYVHQNKTLSTEQKKEYLKILRAQLSTHEQILIFFNCVSDLGAPWELDSNVNTEDQLISKYELIKNIPLGTVYGFNPKEFFPRIKFENEFT